MNRLTKKDNRFNCGYQLSTYYNKYEENVIIKLGKLEDLEEQLGCPLEVILKATKNGIVDWEGKEHQVLFKEDHLFVEEYDKLMYGISLKNYKKTWWLKGEKPNE